MANATAFYKLDTGTASNWFSGIWKLTRCMKQAGWTYKASGDGTTKEASGSIANDKWGGNAAPLNDLYPTALSAANAWWCAAGPSVVKVPITVTSVGSFIRGEQVSQATSAATGELLGYVFDITNSGWLIIMPRTGTFDNSHLITGAISAATVTPNGTVKVYNQEVVFWKDTSVNNGTIYWIMADAAAENSSLFSVKASQGNNTACNAQVAPGGGGTNNAFPAVAICIAGTGGSNAPTGWATGGTPTAHCIIGAADATSGSNSSADGTAWVMFSDTSTNTATRLMGIFRLDDTEQGDVSPFEWLFSQSTSQTSYSRTTAPADGGGAGTPITWSNFSAASTVIWNGYIARGIAGDAAGSYHKVAVPLDKATASPMMVTNNASQIRVQNHPAGTRPLFTDTLQLFNDLTNFQQVKGRPRWLRFLSSGNVYDSTDVLTWIVWMSATTNTNPAVLVGPWDGGTVPAT